MRKEVDKKTAAGDEAEFPIRPPASGRAFQPPAFPPAGVWLRRLRQAV